MAEAERGLESVPVVLVEAKGVSVAVMGVSVAVTGEEACGGVWSWGMSTAESAARSGQRASTGEKRNEGMSQRGKEERGKKRSEENRRARK
jgi:hypothetical protein